MNGQIRLLDLSRAAFERVSRLMIQVEDRLSVVDFRTAELPTHRASVLDYEPRDHRDPKNPIKVWMAYFNVLRTLFGAGVLGMPLAISQAGLVLGPFLALFTGGMIVHTQLLLIMDWDNSKPAVMTLLLPYLLMEYFMKNLKIISYVALLGNLLNILGLIIAFYHVFKHPQGEVIIAASGAIQILFSFGTFLFNLSAMGVILSVDKAVKDPRVMTKKYGVVKVGIIVPTIVAMIFGTLGYWSFGTMEENILRSLAFDDYSSMVCIGMYLIAVALSYPIQCYPCIQVIREVLQYRDPETTPSDTTLKHVENISRPIFVFTSFLICYLVPFQGPFVAFVGNLCTTLLALVFPATMDLCLRYPDSYGKHSIILIKNIAIIVIGLTSWVFGVILCTYLIYIRGEALLSATSEIFL